jgi:hypothetical protein
VTAPSDAWAADRYRVEILVLRHLNSTEEARVLTGIRDYSSALDFLAPETEEDTSSVEGCEDESLSPADTPMTGDSTTAAAVSEDPVAEEEPDPNAVVHVPEMGAEMQDAWRRLRLSGPFRPLQFLAWEQGGEAPFPELRIHDEQVVWADDPYADLREIEIYSDEYGYGDDTAGETDPCAEPGPAPFPEPTLYYALDGTVALKRSRFLHLHFDLQWREAAAEPVIPAHDQTGTLAGEITPSARPGVRSDGEAGRPAEFLVHALEQNRQVRSSRMEYFDGPVIGILAWVTTIPLEDTNER